MIPPHPKLLRRQVIEALRLGATVIHNTDENMMEASFPSLENTIAFRGILKDDRSVYSRMKSLTVVFSVRHWNS